MSWSACRSVCAPIALSALLVVACSDGGGNPGSPTPGASGRATISTLSRSPQRPPAAVTVVVTDEAGKPLSGAQITYPGGTVSTGADGEARVDIGQPVLSLISAESRITEPVAIDPAATSVHVRLLDRVGPSGATRVVFQFGGDVMLSRRYLEPERSDTAQVVTGDGGGSARAVVSELAPLFAAADFSTVNLESVIGDLDPAAAYPGKRYLLQSPPEVLDALHELGVDLVTLGNNHTNDWQGAGIESTISALDAAGMAHVGAGVNEADASRPSLVTVNGVDVGVLSYTSVTGDFVNDSLPDAGEEVPADLPLDEEWKYDARPFGWGAPGQPDFVAPAPRRPGEIWGLFEGMEGSLNPWATAALWTAITAPDAYPELQDWVARRGHGGAANFSTDAVRRDVAALRAQGADLVIVQLHSGFQFAELPSGYAADAARASVDAGADIVVGHHPHVLQGLEWYKGHLIASSLGNLVFDQDFLSTFPSAVLRVVFEGPAVVDARLLPVVIDRYRPVPATGAAAQRIIRTIAARSAAPATAERTGPLTVNGVVASSRPDGASAAVVIDDRGSGQILTERQTATSHLVLDDEGFLDLPPGDLVRADPDSDVDFGRDLLGVGGFDDLTADGDPSGAVHWQLHPDQGSSLVYDATGDAALHLEPSPDRGAEAHPVARVTRLDHRFVNADGTPADGDATYSLRMSVRRTGPVPLQATLDVYYVDDMDPTREPDSYQLRTVQVDIAAPADGAWHRVTVDLPAGTFLPSGGRPATAALVHLEAGAAPSGSVEIDDFEVLEWRAASAFPADSWHEVDALRGGPAEAATIELG